MTTPFGLGYRRLLAALRRSPRMPGQSDPEQPITSGCFPHLSGPVGIGATNKSGCVKATIPRTSILHRRTLIAAHVSTRRKTFACNNSCLINGLMRFRTRTENPRFGGSILQFHPWPPFKSILQIKKLHQSAWTLCLIFAPVSNISVLCSLDQYGSRGAAGTVVLRPGAVS